MLRTLLDKLYSHGSEEDKETAVNVLSASITDLQYAELMRLEAEIDDYIASLREPPDEEEIKLKYPAMCEGCEE